MPEEILLENAPLIEVIAEVRWELVPLGLIPGAAIDPYFDLVSNNLSSNLRQIGFGVIEPQVPPEVPRELVAHNAVNRYRAQPGAWPLYQHGPGVFTCNITPPYDGWTGFRPILEQGIKALIASYPAPSEMLKVNGLILRYVDAFTEKHGRVEPDTFMRQGLGVWVNLPDRFSEELNLRGPNSTAIDMKFSGTRVTGTSLGLKLQPAKKDDVEATLLELNASVSERQQPDPDAIMAWFDDAKGLVGDAFRALTDGIRDKMGPERVHLT